MRKSYRRLTCNGCVWAHKTSLCLVLCAMALSCLLQQGIAVYIVRLKRNCKRVSQCTLYV